VLASSVFAKDWVESILLYVNTSQGQSVDSQQRLGEHEEAIEYLKEAITYCSDEKVVRKAQKELAVA
jgi:hypothetical protein